MTKIVAYEIYDDKIEQAIDLFNKYNDYRHNHKYGDDQVENEIITAEGNRLWSDFYDMAINSVKHTCHPVASLIYSAHPLYRTPHKIRYAIEALGLNVNIVEDYEI